MQGNPLYFPELDHFRMIFFLTASLNNTRGKKSRDCLGISHYYNHETRTCCKPIRIHALKDRSWFSEIPTRNRGTQMRRNCGSHHNLVTAYHPHRHCGSGILIIWQPCRRENYFVGVAKLDQPPRVEEITPLCFPQTTTTTTHPYPHSVKLLDQGVFTSIHIRAHDKNYQNREGRVNHRRHATSSTLAVLSRATGVLHVSTHIS
jgi:hypothetical protein